MTIEQTIDLTCRYEDCQVWSSMIAEPKSSSALAGGMANTFFRSTLLSTSAAATREGGYIQVTHGRLQGFYRS